MNAAENQIVVYQPDATVRLEVRLEKETVWLTQARLGVLFGVDRSVVNRHIRNIYKTGELDEGATCAKNAQVQNEGGRVITRVVPFYNLDMIIAVGYRVNSMQATRFRQWATKILREYLLRGFAVNARLNQLEDKVDRHFAKHDTDIAELKDKVDFFVQTQTPPLQGVFFDGQLWDARSLVLKMISRAKKSIILIDNWATADVLDLFAKKNKAVSVTIFTSEHFDRKHVPDHKISETDIRTFNAQYPKLSVRFSEVFHDRFLIIDDKELYLIGASLKDLGRKCFAFTKLDAGEICRIKKAAFGTTAKPPP